MPDANASRKIFSEPPETLENYFGSPVAEEECIPEARDQPTDSPDGRWCYFPSESAVAEGLKAYRQYRQGEDPPALRTYRPPSLADVFADFTDYGLEILFVNNQAREVRWFVSGSTQLGKIFTYSPAQASQLFRYIFGYPAPIWHPYREEIGLVPTTNHEVCLGDGVATSFTLYGTTGPVPSGRLFYNSECEASQYTFPDVQNHWAQAFIENLSARNIINGFPDGTYRPNAPITRSEMAALISGAFSASSTRPPIEFVDVDEDFWARAAIQTAYRYGFLSGYPNRIFRPNQPMPKVQVMVALSGRLSPGSNDMEVLSFYRDAREIPDYARRSVAKATEAGLAVNYPIPKVLNPNRPITRGEAAAVLYQALFGDEEFINSPYIVVASELPSLEEIAVSGLQASEVGADYSQLAEALAALDFQAADEETRKMLERIASREKPESVSESEKIDSFPCTDLRTIDRLWRSGSGGQFGVGVQANVWQDAMDKPGASWATYARRVGWIESGTSDRYKISSELTFNLDAPAGHLPAIGVWGAARWQEDTFGPGTGSPVDTGTLDLPISRTTRLLQRAVTCQLLENR